MRRQEEFHIDKNEGWSSRAYLASAIRTYQPSVWSQMKETFEYMALDHNTLSYGMDAIKGGLAQDNHIPFEMWNEEYNPYYREGIKWHNNFTETDARILAERYDRDKEWELKMGNTDPFSIHNIGAALGAAVFDPLSYIPFVGPVSKLATGTKTAINLARIGKHTADIGSTISMKGIWSPTSFAVKRVAETSRLSKFINPVLSTTKTVFSPLKPVGKYAMEGMFAESAFQIVKNMSDVRQEEDLDYMGGVFDVMIAGIFGGVLGTLPMAAQFRRAFKKEQLHLATARAVQDLGNDGYVHLDGTPPNAEPRLSPEDNNIKFNEDLERVTPEQTELDADRQHGILSFVLKQGNKLVDDIKGAIKLGISTYRRCSQ